MVGELAAQGTATLDPFGGGHWAEERDQPQEPGCMLGPSSVAGALGGRHRALEIGGCLLVAVLVDLGEVQQHGGQPLVVAEGLELVKHGIRRCVERDPIRLARRAGHRHAQLDDAGARRGEPVVVRVRELQGGGRGFGATLKVPELFERIGELDEDRRPVGLRSQRERPLQEPDRCGTVATDGPSAGGAKAARRARRKRCGGGLGLAELAPEHDGALEVVSEQLIGDCDLTRPGVEPVREALVEIGAQLLGHALVGAVADQLVAEAEDVLARRRPSGSGPCG